MITRDALFDGHVDEGQVEAFRAAVLAEVLPTWKAFPGALAVRVGFAIERDPGAPSLPMLLAISYRDRQTVDAAPASPARAEARAATEAVLSRCFTGRIHQHVCEAHEVDLPTS